MMKIMMRNQKMNTECRFYFNNGDSAGDLHEFIAKVRHIDDATFRHHMNNERNDFYLWIRDGLEKPALANGIRRIKTAQGLARKLSQLQ